MVGVDLEIVRRGFDLLCIYTSGQEGTGRWSRTSGEGESRSPWRCVSHRGGTCLIEPGFEGLN